MANFLKDNCERDRATVALHAAWRKYLAGYFKEGTFESFMQRYAESHRGYHNFGHIADMLRKFEEAVKLGMPIEDKNAFVAAIFFHDVIYDPQAKDNEEQSAGFLKGARNFRPFKGEEAAVAMILATKQHLVPVNRDTAFFLDLDLSILGEKPAVYDQYATAIRQEYSFAPELAYCQGRAQIMQGFLNRERLFYTGYGQGLWENKARRNMAHEIQQLNVRAQDLLSRGR